MVKVNFDAAYKEDTGAAAWGFVVRNDNGQFLAAAAGKLEHIRSPLQAEANACLKVIEGASELGAQGIVIESDCMTLQQKHEVLAEGEQTYPAMASKPTLVTVALQLLLLLASTPKMAVSIPAATTAGTAVPSAPATDDEAAEVPADCRKVVQQAGSCKEDILKLLVPALFLASPLSAECCGVLQGALDRCLRELFDDSVGQLYAPLLTQFCGIPTPSGRE
ncbi:hypothetical protein D1007_27196 [Hordeum vulgare]|nr:hypothetical protein D1007_27196 [Hordeum vulgare]